MLPTILAAALAVMTCVDTPAVETDAVPAPVQRLIDVTDLVLDNHFEPPTRQQMVLVAARALYEGAQVRPPADLSRRVSDAPDAAGMGRLLAGVWRETESRWRDEETTPARALLDSVAASVPGHGRLVLNKDHTVNNQVAQNLYVGTGIALRMDEKLERAVLIQVFEGGPAHKAGALQNDVIEKIDDADTKGMPLRRVIDLLRGPKGSRVTMTLRQPESSAKARTYTITRDVVPMETLTDYRAHTKAGAATISSVGMRSISGSAVHELRKISRRMEADGARGLVLDMRRNSGGTLHHAKLFADAFLDGGPIGKVRFREGGEAHTAERECLLRDVPIAIVIDSATHGAAAWFAAALQDRGRAIVVGTRSSGDSWVRRGVTIDEELVFIMATGILERADGSALGYVSPDHDIEVLAKEKRAELERYGGHSKKTVAVIDVSVRHAVDLLRDPQRR